MFTFLERYLSRVSAKSMPVDLDHVKLFMGFCTIRSHFGSRVFSGSACSHSNRFPNMSFGDREVGEEQDEEAQYVTNVASQAFLPFPCRRKLAPRLLPPRAPRLWRRTPMGTLSLLRCRRGDGGIT